MSTRLSILCIVLVLFTSIVLFIPAAHAQKNDPPSGQFGVGVYAISTSLPSGLQGTYAINQNVQVGTGFSFSATSGFGTTGTTYLLSPFARYLFNSTVSPFVQGGFQLLGNAGHSNTGIFIGGGVAYYLNHEIGVTAGVDILNLFFSPSSTNFGWSIVRVGADWFF
jgi:hypothetical protein